MADFGGRGRAGEARPVAVQHAAQFRGAARDDLVEQSLQQLEDPCVQRLRGERLGRRRAGGLGRRVAQAGGHAARASTPATVGPNDAGSGTMVTPHSCRISTFSAALSPKAEMIAPAWPILRPFGAVRPAM